MARLRPIALHLPEAVRVDGVPAWQHGCRPHAVKEVLKAHRTVLPHAVLHADVIVLQHRSDLDEGIQGKTADLEGTVRVLRPCIMQT